MRAEPLDPPIPHADEAGGDAGLVLAVPGRNCWRREPADRLAVLVDGQDYFHAVKQAILRARHSILLIGWDLDSRTELDRGPGSFEPNSIGALLDHAVRHNPDLRAHVLIWDTALIYSWQREFLTELKFRLLGRRRLRFRRDDNHPVGASQHQKIIVIDDKVAFVGGLDVTSGRWDTPDHAATEPRRHDPVVGDYAPFHDVAALVSGPVAAALGDLARMRWRGATGQRIRPPPAAGHDPWPPGVEPLMRHVLVAIARTGPAWDGHGEIREVERLYLDMIAAARRFVYVENQFFASRVVGRAMLARLQSEDPPEIAVVTCQEPVAFLERATMGFGRARLYAKLRQGDRLDRLRLYTPVVPGSDVKVHSKMAIVDDRVLRIGSANLNNRSMGLDSECDLLVEAAGDPAVEAAIRAVRCRLIGEHVGLPPERVAAESARRGLHATLASPAGAARRLLPLEATIPDLWAELLLAGDPFDQDRPVESVLAEETPKGGVAPQPLLRKVMILACGLAVAALTVAAAHRLVPLFALDIGLAGEIARDLKMKPAGLAFAGAAFLLAGLTPLPVTLPLVLAGAVYGLGFGLGVALLASWASAILGFGLGRLLGRDLVKRLSGRGMSRVLRALPRRGILVVTMLRLMPVAPFAVANLVAGAARMRFSDYVLGTVVGLVPVAAALTLFGDRAAAVLRDPSWFNIGILILLTAALIVVQHSLARRLSRAATAEDREVTRE